jgi:hypothetical protein
MATILTRQNSPATTTDFFLGDMGIVLYGKLRMKWGRGERIN